MKKIVLASHGDLSKGMLHSLKMIIGEPACEVETVTLYPGESAVDYASNLKERALKDKKTQYIVIADVLGGSVHTAFTQILEVENICLYSGMNLGLVLEIVTNNQFEPKNGLSFVSVGQKGITYLNSAIEVELENEDF